MRWRRNATAVAHAILWVTHDSTVQPGSSRWHQARWRFRSTRWILAQHTEIASGTHGRQLVGQADRAPGVLWRAKTGPLISLAKSAWRRHASPWRIFGTAGADEATPKALAVRRASTSSMLWIGRGPTRAGGAVHVSFTLRCHTPEMPQAMVGIRAANTAGPDGRGWGMARGVTGSGRSGPVRRQPREW